MKPKTKSQRKKNKIIKTYPLFVYAMILLRTVYWITFFVAYKQERKYYTSLLASLAA